MFINPRAKVLAHVDRLVSWQRGRKVAPVTVEWDLSNRCVLGCEHCHFAHTHTRGPWVVKDRRLPMAFDPCGDLADPIVVRRALREMAHAGVKAIVWSGGGEPTTHPQWLEIVEYAKSLGLQQGMYTLGGLLTPETAARLAAAASWVVVSLDCADAQSYATEKGVPGGRFIAACDGIRELSKGTTVGVSFLLHGGNWRRWSEMLGLSRALGSTYTTFRPAIQFQRDAPATCTGDRGWVTEALPWLEALERTPDVEVEAARFVAYRDWAGRDYDACKGIQLTTVVTPDGRVWLCPQRRGFTDSVIGDLSTESFAALWARHPGAWSDFRECRVMCRLHAVNEQIAAIQTPRVHEAFV